MFNRIRVVTMLMMVLGVFALLQLVSGGLLFSSLQQNQQSFVISNDLRQQQSELTSTWDLMLQTRINLSRSSARMMMDASNQQSSAKNDLLKNAKASLAQAETHYAKFKNITPLPEMAEASGNVEEKISTVPCGLGRTGSVSGKRQYGRLLCAAYAGNAKRTRRGAGQVCQR